MMSTPVRSSGRALVKATSRSFSYGMGPCKATVPPELPQTLDAVAGRADKDRSDSPATLKRQGIHDDPAATLVRPGADRTPPFRAGGRRLAPVPRPDRSGAVRGRRPPAPVGRHPNRRLEPGP